MDKITLSRTKRLTISAMVIALYVVVMLATENFSFGAYQFRVATALYSLTYFFPFLVLPLGIANGLSNVMGGMPIDIIGGFAAGIVTAGLNALIGKKNWHFALTALPIALVPSLLVPIWLSFYTGVPYGVLFVSLVVGQSAAGVVGAIVVGVLRDKVKHMV